MGRGALDGLGLTLWSEGVLSFFFFCPKLNLLLLSRLRFNNVGRGWIVYFSFLSRLALFSFGLTAFTILVLVDFPRVLVDPSLAVGETLWVEEGKGVGIVDYLGYSASLPNYKPGVSRFKGMSHDNPFLSFLRSNQVIS